MRWIKIIIKNDWRILMKSEAIVELGKPLQTIESETPEPKGKEVLLKITHSGVCH